MEPLLAIILSRAVERVLVIAAGIVAIWIGYRLFVLMPARDDGESKLELPGGISIFISRVGPGVLFALFGAALIAYAATKPISFEQSGAIAEPGKSVSGSPTIKLQTMSAASTASANAHPNVPPQSLTRAAALAMINTWLRETTAGVDQRAIGQRTMAAREAKLAIMREVWEPTQWGAYDSFHQWVIEQGAQGEPPAANAQAARAYRQESP
jgi:hypothetical protein